MKIQIKKIVGVLLACAGIMTSTSCADFEEINKNLKKAQDLVLISKEKGKNRCMRD